MRWMGVVFMGEHRRATRLPQLPRLQKLTEMQSSSPLIVGLPSELMTC